MIHWIILGIVALIFVIVFSRVHHFGSKFFRLSIIFILLLLLFGVSMAYINGIDLSKPEGLLDAGKLYGAWLLNAGNNLAKITGYAINQDWSIKAENLSQNSTNITK